MEISGRIIQVLPLQSGTSKTGNAWKKQEYVLETKDNYPRKVKFDFFGERVDQFPLAVGDDVIVSFDLESREFNGRWYTDVRGWKAEKISTEPTMAPVPNEAPTNYAPAANFGAPAVDPFAAPASDESDDLPF